MTAEVFLLENVTNVIFIYEKKSQYDLSMESLAKQYIDVF